jgi:hypothetical protein
MSIAKPVPKKDIVFAISNAGKTWIKISNTDA